jgi:hypothetical protein
MDEHEEKLKLYAFTCATLDSLSSDSPVIQSAFVEIWNKAMQYENAVQFYKRIDFAKRVLGFTAS